MDIFSREGLSVILQPRKIGQFRSHKPLEISPPERNCIYLRVRFAEKFRPSRFCQDLAANCVDFRKMQEILPR